MSEKYFHWTVDVESDWGGRTLERDGIERGLPIILEVFKTNKIQGLFFISTELLKTYPSLAKDIQKEGHEIGSHGHFHIVYDNRQRALQDKEISERILGTKYFRAPKFSLRTPCIYSNPKNHVGLLKHMWFKQAIPKDPIFYLHPFDLIGGKFPPNVFCRWWYSRPKEAIRLFSELCSSVS